MSRMRKRISLPLLLLCLSIGGFFYYDCFKDATVPVNKELSSAIFNISRNVMTKSGEKFCDCVLERYNISMTSYVMALSYWEQLTMATSNLCGLTNFARSWHSRVVMPFTLNSELYGLPSTVDFPIVSNGAPIHYEGPTKSMSMLYDVDSFNSDLLCKKYNLPPLASFVEFIRNANRKIKLLHINFENTPPQSFFNDRNCVNCEEFNEVVLAGSKLIKALNKESDKYGLAPFELHSACCLNHMHIIKTPQEIADACGFANNDHLTIVFTAWRGYRNIPTTTFRLITEGISDMRPSELLAYPLNKDIVSNSSAFTKSFLCDKTRKLVVIHLRTGQIVLQTNPHSAHKMFKSCLENAQKLLKTLGSGICYRYFVDYGEFGSHSYEISDGQNASAALLQQEHITPVRYDPRKFGGIKDQGFVALVEQLSMAQSDILILVGGGSFQEQIRKRFIQDGHGSRVYEVCHIKKKLAQMVYERHHLT